MKKIAVFPGSFNPMTIGHEDIVLRALPLFDELIIAVGFNSYKSYEYSPEDRKTTIEKIFKNHPKVTVVTYSGLTVDFCKFKKANFILTNSINEISELPYYLFENQIDSVFINGKLN